MGDVLLLAVRANKDPTPGVTLWKQGAGGGGELDRLFGPGNR